MSYPGFIEQYEVGDHISAEQWNLRGDLHGREHVGQTLDYDATGFYHRTPESDRHLVLMKNSTDDDRDRYEVAGVDDSLHDQTTEILDFKYRVGVEGIVPVVPDHVTRFGVFQEPVLDGLVGVAKLAGVTQVQVDILEKTDPFCDVKDGDCTQLESNSTGGSTIIYPNPPTATGTQWCIVRIEGTGVGAIWRFELAAELSQWDLASGPVAAYRRVFDPSANAGNGGWVVDCAQSLVVMDMEEAGFYGIAGANGWAEMMMSDNGLVGSIRGLNCPNACVCGTDYTETAPCA